MSSLYDHIPESSWEFVGKRGEYLISRCYLDADRTQYVERKQFVADETLLKLNQTQWDNSDGKRWGDGQVVARVPLNKFYAELAPHIKQGDDDHMKWWLNKDENKAFRTFKGKGDGTV